MKINTTFLKSVLNDADFINLGERIFDYIDIIEFSARNINTDKLESVLWYSTQSASRQDYTWYGEYFNRSVDVIHNVIANHGKNWTFMIDDPALVKKYPAVSFVLVKNVKESIELIYKEILEKTQPTVFGITGSVGKTTAAAMLEELISSRSFVLRIYILNLLYLSL